MISVFKYKDISYIKHDRYQSDFLVNGQSPTKTQSPEWSMFKGDVESITETQVKYGGVSHYELKDKYYELVKQNKLSIEEYDKILGYDDDDDDDESSMLDFYTPVYHPSTTTTINLEFEMWNADREPQFIPDYIQISFPHNLTELREFAYVFPCSISGKPLFNLIWHRVAKKINNNPNFRMLDGNFTLFSNGNNIEKGEMYVSRRIIIPDSLQKDEIKEYYKHWNSKKKSTKTVRHTEKWVPTFSLVHTQKECTIHATNYDTLQKLIEDKIQYYENQIDDNVWSECECCKGIGLIYKEKA